MAGFPERFSRVDGRVDLRLLSTKSAVVVGLGSVGSQVAKELAASNIGELRMFDGKIFNEEHLGRHALTTNYVGMNKAVGMKLLLAREVPSLTTEAKPQHIREDFADGYLDQCLRGAQLIVVATDNRAIQRLVGRHALALDIPAVFPGLYERNGGEVFVQRSTRWPCFFCRDHFRPADQALREVSATNPDILGIVKLASQLSLAILDTGCEYFHRLMTPSAGETTAPQLFVDNGLGLARRSVPWYRDCPCGGSPLTPEATEPPVVPVPRPGTFVTAPLPEWPTPPIPSPRVSHRPPPAVTRTPTANQSASRNLMIGWSLLAALVLFVLFVGESGGGSHVTPAEERQEKANTLTQERPAANARIAHLRFRCIEQPICRTDFVGNPLPLFIDGLDVRLASYLQHNGYQQQWSDNDGTLHAEGWDDGENGYVAVGTGGDKSAVQAGTGYILASPAASTEKPGPTPTNMPTSGRWVITWQLKEPRGRILKTLRYAVRVRAACGTSANSYCERVGRKQMEGLERGTTAGAVGGYSTAAYQPPPLFPYSE